MLVKEQAQRKERRKGGTFLYKRPWNPIWKNSIEVNKCDSKSLLNLREWSPSHMVFKHHIDWCSIRAPREKRSVSFQFYGFIYIRLLLSFPLSTLWKRPREKDEKITRTTILVGLFWILKQLQNSKQHYCFLLPVLHGITFVYFVYRLFCGNCHYSVRQGVFKIMWTLA